MKRTVVVGTSCSGKTTLARQLAEASGVRHIEMDALFWLPNWQQRARDEFRELLAEAVAADSWVLDGNYGWARDIVLPRATHVVWLDYSFPLVFWRAVSRTVRRILTQERVCGDNRESFREAFLSHDGIPWWVIRTHQGRRRRYGELWCDSAFGHLDVIRLRHPREADALVQKIRETRDRGNPVHTL